MTQFSPGNTRPGDSIMRDLDAAVKLICFILLLVAVLTTDTPAGYTGMLLFVTAAAYLARLEKKQALGTVRRFWWLLLLVILSNFAFYAPDETFGAWWIFTPSVAGLYKGVSIALRMAMLLVLANVLSCTTAPLKLIGAFEYVLSPLAKMNIPVDRFITTAELSARLLPVLFEDAEFIRLSQKAKGVTFKDKNFLNKGRVAQPLLMPSLIAAFKKVEKLSLVMEARGYGAECKAFHAEKPEPAAADWAALMVCAAVCAMQIIIL